MCIYIYMDIQWYTVHDYIHTQITWSPQLWLWQVCCEASRYLCPALPKNQDKQTSFLVQLKSMSWNPRKSFTSSSQPTAGPSWWNDRCHPQTWHASHPAPWASTDECSLKALFLVSNHPNFRSTIKMMRDDDAGIWAPQAQRIHVVSNNSMQGSRVRCFFMLLQRIVYIFQKPFKTTKATI